MSIAKTVFLKSINAGKTLKHTACIFIRNIIISRYEPMLDFKTILIIKNGALGDVVRTSFLLVALKKKYNADIIWWTSQQALPLIEDNPYITHCITEVDKKINADWVISLDDEIEILEKLSNITYSKISGAFIENGVRTYSDDLAEWFDMGLLSKFGKEQADEKKKLNTRTHIQILSDGLGLEVIPPLMHHKTVQILSPETFNIGFNLSAGLRWKNKGLPNKEAIALISYISKLIINGKHVRCFILGGKDDVPKNEIIMKHFQHNDNVQSAGWNHELKEYINLIANLDYIFTSDSLAMHLAIYAGVPNLSFYAPTSAAEIESFGTGVKVISTSTDYCNYKSDADNSSLTATRLIDSFECHIKTL